MKNKITVVDLFCGGGIGAIGILKSGCKIIYAIDINKYAVETYNKNIANCCYVKDIRKLDINEIPNSDIIMGSPVCKPFSFDGNNKGELDIKYGDLTNYYFDIIKQKKPKALVFENVKGMLSRKHILFFKEFISNLDNIGYNISYKLINATEYNTPQSRERIIVVGIRKDLNIEFKFPIIENKNVSILSTLKDLPQPSKILNSKKDILYNRYTNYPNHYGYGIRNDEKKFINKIPPGGNWRNLNEDDAKEFLGQAFYNGGGRTGFLRRVDVNKSSYTITAFMNGKNNAQILNSKELNNSYDDVYRRFTVRECLRLQDVPDSYVISDEISISKQYEIVGNGIPCNITYYIFNEIKNILEV